MASSQDKIIRSENLLQQFFDRTLTDEESRELLELWGEEPSLEKTAYENIRIEAALRFFAKLEETPISHQPEGHTPIVLEQPTSIFRDEYLSGFEFLDAEEVARLVAQSPSLPNTKQTETTPSKPEKPVVPYRKASKSEKTSRLTWLAGLCLVALFGFFVYQEFRPKQDRLGQAGPEPTLARVTRVADPVFPEGSPVFKQGQSVIEEDIRLHSGLLELEFSNGVRCVLQGPVVFNLHSKMKTFCESGRVTVDVPKQAIGFEVNTPFMNVRDLGTAFVVDVDEHQSAVHVIEGKVEVEKLDGDWYSVTEGLGRLVDSQKQEVQLKADDKLYTSRSHMEELATRFENESRAKWMENRSIWKNDAALLFDLDFSDPKRSTGFVRMVGAYQTEGRWKNNAALAFPNKNDAVSLSIPAKRNSFTLIASIRLDHPAVSNNVIFSCGDEGEDAIHWQINQFGQIQLLLGRNDNVKFDNYPSNAVFGPRQAGVWCRLAVTVDAETRTVTHYLDGRPVASLPLKNRKEFAFSQSVLGNWLRSDRSPTQRHLNGRIDEFVILGRAVSSDEIKHTYP